MQQKKLIMMLGLVSILSSGGCAYQHRALLRPAIPVSQANNDAHTKKVIENVLLASRWDVVETGKDFFIAKHSRGDLSATVKITYANQRVEINYVDSTNLRYEDVGGRQTIHSRYNLWVRHLSKKIRKAFIADNRAGTKV